MKVASALLLLIAILPLVYGQEFGEVATKNSCHCLNFSLYPNSIQSKEWGVINPNPMNLSITIAKPVFNSNSSLPQPKITLDACTKNNSCIVPYPELAIIPPNQTVFINVTVNSTGINNGTWSGQFVASTLPFPNQTGGTAVISLSTIKHFYIHVAPTISINTSNTSIYSTTISSTTTLTSIIGISNQQSSAEDSYLIPVVIVAVIVIVCVIGIIYIKNRNGG